MIKDILIIIVFSRIVLDLKLKVISRLYLNIIRQKVI